MHAYQRTRLAVLAATVLLAVTVASGQQPPTLSPAGTIPVLESYLEALRLQSGIPGMSATVLRDGIPIWGKGYGFQDVSARLRATSLDADRRTGRTTGESKSAV